LENSRGNEIAGDTTTIFSKVKNQFTNSPVFIGRAVSFLHINQQQKEKQMITLEANYSKKIGLPGYSSHQFSVTLKSELADVSQVEQESARLYSVLQQSVDNNIQQIGYLPNGNGNGSRSGNGHTPLSDNDKWNCTVNQKELILKITDEHKLDKNKVEQLANDRFSKGVKQLNKLEASGLIEEMLEMAGQPKARRFQKAGAR
jgi:hypothetical protein